MHQKVTCYVEIGLAAVSLLFLHAVITIQLTNICQNLSTSERLRDKFVEFNPYDQGVYKNVKRFWKEVEDDEVFYNTTGREYILANKMISVKNTKKVKVLF